MVDLSGGRAVSDKISVIVPVYNVEKYLPRCIDSILNQTYKNLEIILVDDGSPDNCPAICDEYTQRDSRIKVIHKENGGVSSARNAGLDVATGEYIGFVDSDDWIATNMYEFLINSLTEQKADISICNFHSVDINGNSYNNVQYFGGIFFQDEILNKYLSDSLCTPCVFNKLFNAQTIGGIRFDLSKKIGEDFLFNYFVFKNAKKIVTVEDLLYYYSVDRCDSAIHKANYELVNRWKNTKYIMETDITNNALYNYCLSRYAKELLCCIKELLRTKNKELINKCYSEITNEIKNYAKRFLKQLNLSYLIKFSIIFIYLFPNLFKNVYLVYSHIFK